MSAYHQRTLRVQSLLLAFVALAVALVTSYATAQNPTAARDPIPPASDPPVVPAQDPSPLAAPEPEEDTGLDWGVDLEARFLYGDISGVLQTPKMGEPGSSTHLRPTLKELGFNDLATADLVVRFHVENFKFTFGSRFIRMSGDSTIQTDLTSQNLFYPAGTDVRAEVKVDWYRFGLHYDFRFREEEEYNRFSVAPGIDALLFDFHYKLNAVGITPVDRAYSNPGMRIGATAAWEPIDRVRFEGLIAVGMPIQNTVRIFSAEFSAVFRLLGDRDGPRLSALIGVGYDELHFEDSQEMPNDIRIDYGPMLMTGLRFSF